MGRSGVRERAVAVLMDVGLELTSDEAEAVLDALGRERLHVVALDPFATCSECGETVSGAIIGPCDCGGNSWRIGGV